MLAITATVASCSKDDDIAKVSGNKYESTYVKITATVNGVEKINEFEGVAKLKENGLYLKVQFKEDKTFWIYQETEEDDVYDWDEIGTWTQKDSKITISVDDETLEATVDGSKLIMKLEISDMEGKKLAVEGDTDTGTIEWHFNKI
ncbi:hypothetical protein MNB_SV-5-1 [hydrothermal vent metagenome]|uniref:Lipocalin-like domain-containing protein n=1 Tax=hydrothermal vent metagenome TaxID=652676 RepID=A0A1W1EFX9_9ZZZZ